MLKKSITIVSCLVLVVLVAVIGVAAWLFSPGVHILFGMASFRLEDVECYVVDEDMSAVVEKTELTLQGWDDDGDALMEEPIFQIAGYVESNQYDIGFLKEDGSWHGVLCVYDDFLPEGQMWTDDEDWVAFGDIKLVGDVPVFRITFLEEESSTLYMVCTGGEEEALAFVREAYGA
ncbi:MAG: hypothetical protein IJW45_06685 [Oscillospiraceae bacterium]|nr:hypothetical protein [Oscillospiraceae bacterium]